MNKNNSDLNLIPASSKLRQSILLTFSTRSAPNLCCDSVYTLLLRNSSTAVLYVTFQVATRRSWFPPAGPVHSHPSSQGTRISACVGNTCTCVKSVEMKLHYVCLLVNVFLVRLFYFILFSCFVMKCLCQLCGKHFYISVYIFYYGVLNYGKKNMFL